MFVDNDSSSSSTFVYTRTNSVIFFFHMTFSMCKFIQSMAFRDHTYFELNITVSQFIVCVCVRAFVCSNTDYILHTHTHVCVSCCKANISKIWRMKNEKWKLWKYKMYEMNSKILSIRRSNEKSIIIKSSSDNPNNRIIQRARACFNRIGSYRNCDERDTCATLFYFEFMD